MKALLRDIPPHRLPDLAVRLGHPAYRGRQIRDWLYRRDALSWDRLHNVPAALRRELARRLDISGLSPAAAETSRDGTHKVLWTLRDGETVESVVIPMPTHHTFCISSQVGCRMACRFCATARGGLVRNLSAGEIVEQVQRLAARERQDAAPGSPRPRGYNVVFMGMGEPLDNLDRVLAAVRTLTAPEGLGLSPRRITISTSGHAAGMQRLIAQPVPVGLTLSVNSTDPRRRRRLMPVPGRTPLPELLALAARYAARHHRRVTIAYVLIAGVNDDPAEARRLADLVAGGPFKVNLIPMNRIDADWGPPDEAVVLAFQDELRRRGVDAFVRISGGEDISAACGQLRRRRAGMGTGNRIRGDRPGRSAPGPR